MMMRTLACLALALLAACPSPSDGGDGDDGGASPPDLARSPASTDDGGGECAGDPVATEVSFAAADGLIVHGTAVAPCGGATGVPVVVLAHQLCRNRREWSAATHDWVGAFARRGIATLAIDLRGHGESTRFPDGSTKNLCSGPATNALYAGMVADVRAAVAHARDALGAPSVALVGASIGSNSAIVAYSEDAAARMVVALSPGLDYRGIRTEPAVRALGPRAALLEAADDDDYSADTVRSLGAANGAVSTQVFPRGGHGNSIIDAHPEELDRVADLVADALR